MRMCQFKHLNGLVLVGPFHKPMVKIRVWITRICTLERNRFIYYLSGKYRVELLASLSFYKLLMCHVRETNKLCKMGHNGFTAVL
ncbi:hypothetical protein HanIR_Chr16g0831311 [Helianthus annuus]|nr:hypothetical protein HanIR_Chr16g0831311 [Helianthus annuus]